MKKFLLSLMGLFIAMGMYAGDTTVSFDFSAQGYTNGQAIESATIDANVTATFDKGTNSNAPKYYNTGTAVRLYGANSMTLTTTTGVIKSVTFTFSSGEGSNEIKVNNGTFSNPTWTGSDETVTFTVDGTSGHRRVKAIEVTYGEASAAPVAVESVSLTDDKGNAMSMYQSLVQGESLQLKAVVAPSNATNKNVTWEVMQNENVISLENGLVKALAPGQAAVVVTTEDGEHQAAVTFIVSEPQPGTIEDFIANEGGTCYLTGVVSNITNTTYGNFDLTDETGTIYVYGCLNAAGEAKKFAELGIEEGNKITVLASTYKLFNDKNKGDIDEAVNVVFVENHGSAPTYTFDVVAGAETFTVTPSDNDVEYYIELLPAEYDAETITGYFDEIFKEMGEDLEYFSGVQTQSYENDWYMDPEEEPGDYVIAVCAVNSDYERASDVTIVPFTFGSTPACTFDVAIDNQRFTITPSDDNTQYYFEPMSIQLMEEYGITDLTEYMDMVLEFDGEYLEYFSGEETEPWSLYMDAEDSAGDYVIAICAVNDNYERTSDVTIVPFSAANMTVTEAGYATFVAPFEVAVPTGVKAYTVEGVEGETLTLAPVSTIAANTPVVLEGALKPTLLVGKTVEGTPEAGLLTGVYEETEAPVGSYVLQNLEAGVGFYKVAEGQQPTVGINRAYLTTESSVKAFSLADATAIKSLEALIAGKAQIYDMNGRQINKLQKGINIVNGVKVLVK